MLLYLLRHGKAERLSATGADRDRALKGRGRRQATWIARAIAEGAGDGLARPHAILTSPVTRAIDTARLVAEVLELKPRVAPDLEVGLDVERAVELVERLAAGASEVQPCAMLVGHNPQLSELVVALTARTQDDLRTGEAALIDLGDDWPGGPARLVQRLRMPDEESI